MRIILCLAFISVLYSGEPIIINHESTDITKLSEESIKLAKEKLHIAYNHTSHGSQLITGMEELIEFANNGGRNLALEEDIFQFNNGGTNGALDLHDQFAGWSDCGRYPEWVDLTRDYLDNPENSDVNVLMWSWCGQVDEKYAAGELWSEYLEPMTQLEEDYPSVTFVYMTGHVDINDDANNKAANDSIRSFCENNNKVLYDFADIERYDPDNNYFEYVDDNCDYFNAEGEKLGNWAIEWQNSHTEGEEWYECEAAHSQPLNANQKAYAAWSLFTQIAKQKNTDDTIKISIDSTAGFYNDTVSVPIHIDYPADFACYSADIVFNHYQSGLEYIAADSNNGMINNRSWTYILNEENRLFFSGFSGGEGDCDDGLFLNLKFLAVGDICTIIPITIDTITINEGDNNTKINNGEIYIKPKPEYGDVDENDSIQIPDSRLILRHLVNRDSLFCQSLANADVDTDQTITNIDAVRIIQYSEGLIDQLPADEVNNEFLSTGMLYLEDHEFQAGGSIHLPIKISKGENIYGFEGVIQYDPSYLQFKEIEWVDPFHNYITEVNSIKDQILFAGANSVFSGQDSIFAFLNFDVRDDVGGESTFITIKKFRWNKNKFEHDVSTANLVRVTGAEGNNNLNIPEYFSLKQNYPNPFNTTTRISYSLPRECFVNLNIFDLSGELISELKNSYEQAGEYTVTWRATDLSTGIYLYRLQAGDFETTKKMLFLK
mgnify:CR=1 FL=1